MTTKHTGGPAFPVKVENLSDTALPGFNDETVEPGAFVVYGGLSVRDYFAAKAMQAILPTINQFPDEHWRVGVAIDAYRMADAMLKARENT